MLRRPGLVMAALALLLGLLGCSATKRAASVYSMSTSDAAAVNAAAAARLPIELGLPLNAANPARFQCQSQAIGPSTVSSAGRDVYLIAGCEGIARSCSNPVTQVAAPSVARFDSSNHLVSLDLEVGVTEKDLDQWVETHMPKDEWKAAEHGGDNSNALLKQASVKLGCPWLS